MTAEELTSTEANEQQIEATAPLDLRTLFTAGVHFGHPTKRWNPKMEEYIFSKRAGAHIIDLSKTISCLNTAKEYIEELVGKGGECLIVGTKGQAQKSIEKHCKQSNILYVNQRWLGGMLTNFQTVQKRIERLIFLEDSFTKGTVETQTKRETLKVNNEIERLNKFFGGIKEMEKIPDVIYVVDTESEHIAVSEANRLKIPVIGIVDTNSDPSGIDYPIPGNDDSIRSIEIITSHIVDAINRGKSTAKIKSEEKLANEADLEAQEEAARQAIQLAAADRSQKKPEKIKSSDSSSSKVIKKSKISNNNTNPDKTNSSKSKVSQEISNSKIDDSSNTSEQINDSKKKTTSKIKKKQERTSSNDGEKV
ncbi:MAG: 30S ribosomal protein S2 [Chloroflexi bacterium]|nr:30S ribosomal protein S2 [Chloroflexota bacterium]|tara:strand:- start:3837 stop:4931 length:1095 start_codon:yes stop_codon:yes gene_type:complete